MTRSYLTVTDLWCGAGGGAEGAEQAGVVLRYAANHWKTACETYSANHDIDADCIDLSVTDPRRYETTDILLASCECTTHSLAKGQKQTLEQEDLFGCELCRRHGESNCKKHSDAARRSRVGGWDIVRFIEYHRYEIAVCENVVDWLDWQDFDKWWRAIELLGYVGQKVFYNAMFAPPVPQSRDRLYVVWHRRGNRAPDLNLRPIAFCGRCEGNVEAIQVFKPRANRKARYGRQYFYSCPKCRAVVEPYYFAALNAIDLSIRAIPIGERAKHGLPPLKPRTMERIQYGIDKYGKTPLVVTVNQTNRLGGRVHPASGALFTQPASAVHGVAAPFVVDVAFKHDDSRKSRAADEPLSTQSARQTHAVVSPFVLHMQGQWRASGLDEPTSTQVASCPQDALLSPFMTSVNDFDPRNVPVDDPRPTQTTQVKFGLVTPPGFTVNVRQGSNKHGGSIENRVRDIAESMGTQTGDQAHAFALPPGVVLNAGSNDFRPRDLAESVPTMTGSERCALALSPAFIASLRGTGDDQVPYTVQPASGPLGTISAGGVHAALINLRDWRNARQLVSGLDGPMPTQVATPQTALLSRAPFLTSYYSGGGQASGVDEPMPAVTTLDRHGIVVPSIEEWCFRMFVPAEIGIGMGFPSTYVVYGNNREKVKQYGNAWVPEVSRLIISRCIEALHPETERYDPWKIWGITA